LTAVTSTSRAEAGDVRGGTAVDRLLAAAPLLASYLVLCLVYIWHSYGHGSPWLFSDELEYAQLSRAIADTGHPAIRGQAVDHASLYTYLLAPVWWLSDTQTAYTAAKYLGAFVMTSAIFPAYGLARMLVPRGPALFAAVATAAVPLLGYSRLITTEVLAYPFAALTFYVAAKALSGWSRYWTAAAILLLLIAPDVRTQLSVLRPTVLLAAAIVLWLSAPVRRFRRSWGIVQWAAVAVGLAVLGHIAHRLLLEHYELYYVATTLPGRMQQFAVWSFGAFAIGIGVVPAIIALGSLWRPRDVELPGYRALVGLLAGGIVCFGLYTVVKTVYLSTVFADVVTERNLVYLSPLVFAATALFLYRPGGAPLVFAAAGAVAGYLVVNTPFQLDHYPYSDAPGLAVLATFNRELRLDDPTIQTLLLWIVAGSVVVAVAALYVPKHALGRLRPALAVVAVAIVAWNLTGLISFGNGINDLGTRLRGSIPDPPNWIDRATGGKPTMFMGQSIADPNPLFVTEFWNRSIVAVGTLDDQAVGPGPTLQIVPYTRDGQVVNDPGVDYVVTNSVGVDPYGTLVEETGDWRLYRVTRPLRMRSQVTGIYTDGWTSAKATYTFFADPGRRGTLDVLASRVAWTGPDKAGDVVLRVGSVVPAPLETIRNPCAGGTCVDRTPRLGTVFGERRWLVHSGRERVFHIRVTTPFKLELTVDPTFSPREFGGTDLRQLGVRAAFAFKPARG
jgi:hypothetical protein